MAEKVMRKIMISFVILMLLAQSVSGIIFARFDNDGEMMPEASDIVEKQESISAETDIVLNGSNSTDLRDRVSFNKAENLQVILEFPTWQSDTVSPGSLVTYLITVENTGTEDITNIEIQTTLDGTWIQRLDRLAGGESAIYEFVYEVPQGLRATTVENAIIVTSSEERPLLNTLPVTINAGSYVATLVFDELIVEDNDEHILRYRITVTNTGTVALQNMVVTTELNSSWIWSIPTLTVGGKEERMFDYRMPAPKQGSVQVDNTVLVNGDGLEETILRIGLIVPQYLVMRPLTSITYPGTAIPGNPITYTVKIENVGDLPITGLQIVSQIGLPGVSAQTRTGPSSLGVGQTWTEEFTYNVPTNAPNGSSISHEFNITGTGLSPYRTLYDVTVKTPSGGGTAILIGGQIGPNGTIAYRPQVNNASDQPLTGLYITMSMAINNGGYSVVYTSPQRTVYPYQTASWDLEYAIPSSAKPGDIIRARVTIYCNERGPESQEFDPIVLRQQTEEGYGISTNVGLADGQYNVVSPNETVRYKATVENTGQLPITNVVITLDGVMVGGPRTILAGQSYTFYFEKNIGNVPEGSRNVTIGVATTEMSMQERQITLYVRILRVLRLDLKVELAPGQRDIVRPGDVIDYVITMKNTGDERLEDVMVIYNGRSNILAEGFNLAVNETWSKTYSLRVREDCADNTVFNEIVTVFANYLNAEAVARDVLVKSQYVDFILELAEGQSNIVQPNETVKYKMIVKNMSSDDLRNLVINSDLRADWKATADLLKEWADGYVYMEYVVPADTPNNTTITNKATLNAEGISSIIRTQDILVKAPGLIVQKKLKPGQSDRVKAGDVIGYDIIVTNTGDIDLNNVVVKDSLDTDGSWTKQIPVLRAGETVGYEFVYVVPSGYPDGKEIVNKVSAYSDEIDENNPSEDEEIVIVTGPKMEVIKSLAPGQSNTVKPGDSIRYIITVKNTGEIDLNNVVVSDSLDTNDSWTKIIPILRVGEEQVYEFVYTVPEGTAPGTVIVNTASAYSDEIDEGNPIEDEETVTVGRPQIQITKTLAPGQNDIVRPGDTIRYVITVKNTGEIDLTNVIVRDSLDLNESWTKTIPVLRVGEEQTFEYTYIVPTDATDGTVITNKATVTANETDNSTTTEAEARVTVSVPRPQMEITKELALDQRDIVSPGDTVNYLITVKNTGQVDITNVIVRDSLDISGTWTKIIPVLRAGETIPYEFTYIVPEGTPNGSVIRNVATATSDDIDANDTTEAEARVTVMEGKLEVVKELASGQSNKVKPGDTVKYIIKVKNIGTIDLTNVIVEDSLDQTGSWRKIIPILRVGEEQVYEFIYTVPEGTTPGTVIVNTASATADEIDNNENTKDEVQITVEKDYNNDDTVSPKELPYAGGKSIVRIVPIGIILAIAIGVVVKYDILKIIWILCK